MKKRFWIVIGVLLGLVVTGFIWWAMVVPDIHGLEGDTVCDEVQLLVEKVNFDKGNLFLTVQRGRDNRNLTGIDVRVQVDNYFLEEIVLDNLPRAKGEVTLTLLNESFKNSSIYKIEIGPMVKSGNTIKTCENQDSWVAQGK